MLCTISGPVSLRNFGTISVINSSRVTFVDVSVNIPFPSPDFFWTVNSNNARNNSLITFGYPRITFHSVEPSLIGLYTLTATNFFLNDSNKIFSTGQESFYLDVLCEFMILKSSHTNELMIHYIYLFIYLFHPRYLHHDIFR